MPVHTERSALREVEVQMARRSCFVELSTNGLPFVHTHLHGEQEVKRVQSDH
jgi:hypothetical protein